MTTALTPYQNASLSERQTYAQTLAAASDLIPKGLWANVRNSDGVMVNAPSPGKILLVAETGAMLGLHPMAALQGIDVIEGKATISPQLMTGLLRSAGHKVRVQSTGTVEGGDYSVTVTLIRSDDPDYPFSSTWTIDRAVRAGLCTYTRDENGKWKVHARSQSGKALPWENYPETMCKWRAIAEVGREGGDDVLKGISYTPEELGGIVNEDGEYVEAELEEPTEPWADLINACETQDEVKAVIERAKNAGELTDEIRTIGLAKYGTLSRASEAPAETEPEEPAVTVEDLEHVAEVASSLPLDPAHPDYVAPESEQ